MSQGKLTIRKASLEDVPVFAKIKADAYADDRNKTQPDPDHIPDWYDGKWYLGLGIVDEREAQRLIQEMECYIILSGDREIGIFWLHVEEPNSYTIEDFCILPEEQGKGYGKESLLLIEKLHPENKQWRLSTPCFCKRNRHLYESHGYHQTGTCSKETVILYEKRLAGGGCDEILQAM